MSNELGGAIGNALTAGYGAFRSEQGRRDVLKEREAQREHERNVENVRQIIAKMHIDAEAAGKATDNTNRLGQIKATQDFEREQSDAARKAEKGKFVLKARNDRPLGAPVTRPEMEEEEGLGNPSAFYDVKPEHQAVDDSWNGPLPEGETRDAQPERITFKGSQEAERKQAEQDRKNEATGASINVGYQKLVDAAEHLRMQGEVNASDILLRKAQADLAESKAKGTGSPKPITLSQGGKSARTAIETAGPLTDQAMEMIRKAAPDIETNPDKYNTASNKFGNWMKSASYKLGFQDPSSPQQQIISLLQPIQAGQYTRSSRSRQMLDLALKHMADPTQTLTTQYQRLKELKSIMPEMLEGIVRGEQPVDASHPLGGSYFDPEKTGGGASDAATAPDPTDPLGIRPKKKP